MAKKLELITDGLKVDFDRPTFGLELKTWRLRHQLTQQQVAQRWCTHRWLIMKAELGRPIGWEKAYYLFAQLAKELREEAQ